ncbi:uncharacterized protein LOC143036470 [Oratosquilla oratoria]|uniref:uncharacterized protein LOC143036470 n=1 Tax=Oratosquilla oratoria TaxID=337810 RepID=UPI003F75F981
MAEASNRDRGRCMDMEAPAAAPPADDEDDRERLQGDGGLSGMDVDEDGIEIDLPDSPKEYDKNGRRSSLGAESLLEHDVDDDGRLDMDTPPLLETLLGYQYAESIFQLKLQLQQRYHPQKCVSTQPQVTEFMRCTLVNWLIKVNHKLDFGPETVFVAVNLLDRFLSTTPIARDCLQLLAVACLFIAAKMEGCNFPTVKEIVSLCWTTYKPQHFRRMEILVLTKLEYELCPPTTRFFVDHFVMIASQRICFDRRLPSMARFTVETCLSSYQVTQFLPSVQAAAAIGTASAILCNASDPGGQDFQLLPVLEEILGTDAEATKECASLVWTCVHPFLETLPEFSLQSEENANASSSLLVPCHGSH